MEKLLPCPFCGEVPTCATYNFPDNWEVTCGSGKCTIHPSTKANYLGANGYFTESGAIATWNTRVSPEREALEKIVKVIKYSTQPMADRIDEALDIAKAALEVKQ